MFYKKNKVFMVDGENDILSNFLLNINDGNMTPLVFYCNILPRYSGTYKCAEWGMVDLDCLTEYNKKYIKPLNFSNIFSEIL